MLKLDDSLKFEMAEDFTLGTRIKVIGIGGGGGNAVARMMQAGLKGVEYFVVNTDRQALMASSVPNRLAIGSKLTNGLGAGSNPAVGRQAALEDTEAIIEILEGTDMVFITAGLGGGTGTGAAPIVASLAKELNALTVAVVTKPFRFEGPRRMRTAEQGLAELAGTVDTVITIPNTRLLEILPGKTAYLEAFRMVDDVLRQAVQGISDLITTPGLINRDFADIRGIMAGMGHAMMSTASATGQGAAIEAARKAIANPLLDEGGVRGAKGVLINISGASSLPLQDIDEACNLIWEATGNDDVHINYGMVLNEEMGDEIKVTVIATGFERLGGTPVQKVEAPQPAKTQIREPEPEPPIPEMLETILDPDQDAGTSTAPEPVAVTAPAPEPAAETAPADPVLFDLSHVSDDLDVPAFLRRKRGRFN